MKKERKITSNTHPIKAVKQPLFINGGRRQNLCAVTPKYLFVGSLNNTQTHDRQGGIGICHQLLMHIRRRKRLK